MSQDPKLTRVEATLLTSNEAGSNLDNDSTLKFLLHRNIFDDWRPIALIQFTGNDGVGGYTREGDTKNFDISIFDSNVTKSQLTNNQTELFIEINAVGRDHYRGSINLMFHFEDDSKNGVSYEFSVGTFQESHVTERKINF